MNEIIWKLSFKKYFKLLKVCPIAVGSVHNFGMSDHNMIEYLK